MSDRPRAWAVVEELTPQAAAARRADSAVDVYDQGDRAYRVYSFDDKGGVSPPSSFENANLIVLTDPEVVLPLTAHFRDRFNATVNPA